MSTAMSASGILPSDSTAQYTSAPSSQDSRSESAKDNESMNISVSKNKFYETIFLKIKFIRFLSFINT